MRPPSKQPPASLWEGMSPAHDQWVIIKPGAVPTGARYTRMLHDIKLAKVTLYGEHPPTLYVVASITVPYDGSLTVAQRQELANAMLDLYVMTHCASSE